MASRARTGQARLSVIALAAIWSSASGIEVGSPILVSHTPSGDPSVGLCSTPVLSATGRFTSFSCMAIDVIPGEPGVGDALLHDGETGLIVGLSYTDQGQWGHCGGAELGTCTSRAVDIAIDGGAAVLNSGAPLTADAPQPTPDGGWPQIYLRDIVHQTTEWLTPPVFVPFRTALARDASLQRREVLYSTKANETGALDTNGPFMHDLFVKNWETGVVELISASPLDQQGDGMSSLAGFSPDGRYVVFQSNAANLTDDNPQRLYNLFLRDRMLGTTRRLTFPFSGGEFSSQPSFSSNLHITADNRHVQFAAGGSEFTEDSDPAVPLAVYEIDLQTGQIDLISRGVNATPLNASAFGAAFSADGRYMAFETAATNVSEDPGALPGVFVRDRLTGETVNVSAALGTPPHTLPGQVALSADGSTVAFSWPRWNATFPTLLDNQQVYKVRLREDRPPLEAVALPAASRVGLVLLVLLLSMAALLSAKTTRWR